MGLKTLVIPWGGPAVVDYRMMKAPFGQIQLEGDPGSSESVEFLEDRGLDWDMVWTNNWGDAGRALTGLIKDRGAELVVDVDDLFEEVPKGNQSHKYWNGENKLRYRKLVAEADRLVVSTPYLAYKYGGSIAPNFVAEEEWDWPRRKREDDKVIGLFGGGTGRQGDLFEIEGPLRAFLEQPNTQMIFMGVLPEWALEYGNDKVVMCRWTPYEEYQRMVRWLSPDILISPLIQDNFNLAKSNIKWLEAGMAEACFVGERWGEYARTVEEDADGVLADTGEEWAEKLVDLARNPQKAAKIAERGRKSVLENWTWQAVEPQWRAAVLGEDHGISAERISGSSVEHPAAANG